MNFRMNIETTIDDYIDGDNVTTIAIIIKLGEYEILRSEYDLVRSIDSSFVTCDVGERITVSKFNEFIEKIEQNMSSVIVFRQYNGENSILFSDGKLVFTNSYYECFLQVTIPLIDQDTRSNFIMSFREFLEEIKSVLNI